MADIPTPPPMQVIVPEDQQNGVYANGVGIWSTAHDFTLDFLSVLPSQQAMGPDGVPVIVGQARVVSRIKLPPGKIFELLQALNGELERYERQHGEIPTR